MRCIKGALEYANVMSFTHVSTAHYTYSWLLLSYASRTKCKVLWLSYVWTNPLTMMLTGIPLTLLQRICYTHAVAPVILCSVILTVLLFHMDLISTCDRIWFYFWTIGMLYGLFLNRSELPSSECTPCSSSSPVALPQHSVGFSAVCSSCHKSGVSSYPQLYLSRSLPMLGMFATTLTEALLMESRRWSAADLALLVN